VEKALVSATADDNEKLLEDFYQEKFLPELIEQRWLIWKPTAGPRLK